MSSFSEIKWVSIRCRRKASAEAFVGVIEHVGDANGGGNDEEQISAVNLQRLEWVSLQPMLEQRSFQNELRTVLKESAPRELAAALGSAGNMHNPKMIALRRPFEEAVLLTPTVKRISAELARYNLQVAGVSTEKLELWAGEGGKRFMCIDLSLEIVHAAKAGRPAKP